MPAPLGPNIAETFPVGKAAETLETATVFPYEIVTPRTAIASGTCRVYADAMVADGRVTVVSVVGGESSGKTTLATGLAEVLGAIWVPEALREYVDLHGRVPAAYEQAALLSLMKQRVSTAVEEAAPVNVVIVDSGPLMTAIYQQMYYDDVDLIDEAIDWEITTSLTVVCAPDIPWQADAQRDGPDFRHRAHQLIVECATERFGDHPWLVVDGPPSRRLQTVVAALSTL